MSVLYYGILTKSVSGHSMGTLWKTTVPHTLSETSCELTLQEHEPHVHNRTEEMPERKPTVYAKFPSSVIKKVTLDELGYLEALTPKRRMMVFSDAEWMSEGFNLKGGQSVIIINHKSLPEKTCGVLRYKGPLRDMPGIHFGVELTDPEAIGKGASSGEFRKKFYFKCDEDCAIFVDLFRIRARKLTTREEESKNATAAKEKQKQDELAEEVDLKVGERVILMTENGPEGGMVRWIGSLFDKVDGGSDRESQITDRGGAGESLGKEKLNKFKPVTAGVEFDNPIGRGTGMYNDKLLFKAKNNHASLVPILGLVREAEFYNIAPVHLSFDDSDEPDSSDLHLDGAEDLSIIKTHVDVEEFEDQEVSTGSKPEIGDLVKVNMFPPQYGLLRYIGNRPGSSNKETLIAGLEMEVEDEQCYTSGTFDGFKLFLCRPFRAFFIHFHRCEKLSEKSLRKRFGNEKTFLTSMDYTLSDVPLAKYLDTSTDAGIQGHDNSSYIDTVLFILFADSDLSLVDSSTISPPSCQEVKTYLLDIIVKTLRKNLYVRADKVLQLRARIQHACQQKKVFIADLGDLNEPEMFIRSLFEVVLQRTHFVKVQRSGSNQLENLGLIHDLSTRVLSMNRLNPMNVDMSLQHLLETIMMLGKHKFVSCPKLLILKVHRSGSEVIHPNPSLDLSDLLANRQRECHTCTENAATLECPSCFDFNYPSLRDITFCDSCYARSHSSNSDKDHHEPIALQTTIDIYQSYYEDIRCELFGVIVREDDHFSCFVQLPVYGSWCYANSQSEMTNQEPKFWKPILTPFPQMASWLNEQNRHSPNFSSTLQELLYTKSYMFFYKTPGHCEV